METRVDIQTKKAEAEKIKWDRERKDIIIGMEKELQSQQLKLHRKAEMKLNSLQSINDHLNVKLKELMKVEQDHTNLKHEYEQSLGILNEQQERMGNMNLLNQQLKDEVEDVRVSQDHQVEQSNL